MSAGIGQAVPRVDGPRKTSGRADYSADHTSTPAAYAAWIVQATIGSGRIVSIDTSEAEALDGVVRVITHRNAPSQRPYGEPEEEGRFTMSHALLTGDRVRHYGEPVAVVVAKSLEVARDAAQRVAVTYAEEEGRYVVRGDEPESVREVPDEVDGGLEPDVIHGDFDEAFASAPFKIDAVYTSPCQISAAMEPHATLAEWDGETLTVHTAVQFVATTVTALANTFELEEEAVRVLAPFVGGGFGSKLGIHSDAVLASMCAMELGHPVRLVQARRQVFHNAPHRGSSHQRLRVAADADGRLLCVGQDVLMPSSRHYPFAEGAAATARAAYQTETMHTTHRIIQVDTPATDSMRAPGEAVGTMAYEAALDELAIELGMDPLAFRLKNLPHTEPGSGKPFVHYDLGHCLERGAEAFGWSERPAPRTREGRHWVGWGVAGCTRLNMMEESHAAVCIDADGTVTAKLDMTDIGNGSYTLLTQVVAEVLGVSHDRIVVDLADSKHPQSSGSGGSFGAASAGGGLYNAACNARDALIEVARIHPDSPLKGRDDLVYDAGAVRGGGRQLSVGDVVALTGESFEMEGSVVPTAEQDAFAQHSYGAHFVELRVDDASGEVRLTRVLGAFSFGRVLNPMAARSQLIGGMVYGIGGALTEGLHTDARFGAFMNCDFAEYHLAVNRDVPPLEVLMLGEGLDHVGPLRGKGIGELGLCGIGGAISNAVFHATGVRVRDFPITPDKVLRGLL